MESLITSSNRCLLVAAAPKECEAVLDAWGLRGLPEPAEPMRLDDRFDLVRSGVGKSAASAATAIALSKQSYHSVISVGIAGALPVEQPLQIGQSIAASRSCFSDEGIGTPESFIPISKAGFAPFQNGEVWIDHDQVLTELLYSIADTSGTIATVSWCSGDDGCAQGVVDRTGATAEAMEGASVALAARMMDSSIRTGELRVISNTTGNRDNQVWDLDGALAELASVLGRLR